MTPLSFIYILQLLPAIQAFHSATIRIPSLQSSKKHQTPFSNALYAKKKPRKQPPKDDAIDADSLGIYTEADYDCKMKFEWDPLTENPNELDPTLEYISEIPRDEEGIEIGWDPIFGPSNPMDERTIINPAESYVVAKETRDESYLPSYFAEGDPEAELNEEVTKIRKSLKIIETYRDEYLEMEVPKNVAEWHGEQEVLDFPKQDFMNNRFTEEKTDFTKLTPYRARKKAVEMARSKNNEWLPDGYSQAYNAKSTKNFHKHGTLVGSLQPGECDPVLVERIQPALKVFGNCVELLSIELGTVYRFHFMGPMKWRQGMQAWMSTLILDCGVECTGVVFETGGRKRDPND